MNIKQVALCISVLTVVGCGGTSSSDNNHSNTRPAEEINNNVQPLVTKRQELLQKSDLLLSEIERLNKVIASTQDDENKKKLSNELKEKVNKYVMISEEIQSLEINRFTFLSSGITNLSQRKARLGQGEAKLAHINLNGQSLDNAIDLSLPMVVQLKGNLDTTGKDSDAVGSIAYNLNGWVAGVVHGYANVVNEFKTHESAIMMSKSFNGLFVEGQLSGISGMNQYGYGLTGSRYLVTLGYDHSAVSPFVQYQYLGFGEFDKQGVYLGLDTDVLSIQTSDAKLTSKVLAKIGYESGFKSNISAYVEWTSSLKLTDGLEISNILNIGPKDQTVKLNVSFEQ